MKTVDAATLKQWLDNGEAVVVDVREPNEHSEARIDGAHLVPLANVDVDALPASDKKLVIHCLKGGRGQKACEKLIAQVPDIDVYNLEGGIAAWAEKGFEVLSTK